MLSETRKQEIRDFILKREPLGRYIDKRFVDRLIELIEKPEDHEKTA